MIFEYPKSFEQVAGPFVVGRDSEGGVTDFAATQCVRYTLVKTRWQVIVLSCFEKDKTNCPAPGGATKPGDVESFTDFFKQVIGKRLPGAVPGENNVAS